MALPARQWSGEGTHRGIGTCIDENTALRFVEGLLDPMGALAVEEHAAGCACCRWILAAAGAGAGDSRLSRAPTCRDEDLSRVLVPSFVCVGEVLNQTYVIERKIGRGGMGTVYQARHHRLPRRFAIKLLTDEMGGLTEAMARLQREAEVTSALAHPNIVQVIDFGQRENGTPYIVMELLEGESLAERLERGGRVVDPQEAVAVVLQAAAGLAAAHRRGVVHRDLKPTNIFLCSPVQGQPWVKVMDFGISKVLGAANELTRDRVIMGSPSYMSPEQAAGRSAAADQRADIFSIGAVLYRMLVGRPPFYGDSVPATLYRVVHEEPAKPRRWHAVPEPLRDVVLWCLRKDPAERPQSVDQLVTALHGALARDRRVRGPARSPGARGRSWWLLGLVTLLFVVCGSGAVVLRAATDSPGDGGARVARSPQPPSAAARGGKGRSPAARRSGATRVTAPSVQPAATRSASGDVSPNRPRATRRHRRRTRRHRPRATKKRMANRPPSGTPGAMSVQTVAGSDGSYLWANVYLDGGKQPAGQTPLVLRRLTPGSHRLGLERVGFVPTTREVWVSPGKRRAISVVLRARR